MDLQKLRYFSRIVQCGSISKAAEELHVSQPFLTRVLNELEEEVGRELFDRRGGRRTQVNRYGIAFFHSVHIVLHTLSSVKEEMDGMDDPFGGRVMLDLQVRVPELPALLEKMAQERPRMQVNFLGKTATDGLLQFESDFIISSRPPDRIPSAARHLYREPVVILRYAPGEQAESTELLSCTNLFFVFQKGSTVVSSLPRLAGFSPKLAEETGSALQMLDMLRSDHSLCALWPMYDLPDQLPEGICLQHLTDIPAWRWINLYYPSAVTSFSPAAAYVLDLLTGYWRQE